MAQVLLVCTDWVAGLYLKTMLAKSSYDVTWVRTVAYGLYHATRTNFNLVILELHMLGDVSVDLAEALMIYDESLPVFLFATVIWRNEEARIARLPIKKIIKMPLHINEFIASVRQYARLT